MTNDLPLTESQAAFARRIGVSRQHIGKLKKAGLPVDASGNVRVREAMQWIRKNVAPANGALSPDGEAGGLMEARIRLLLAQASRAELELAQLEGDLMPVTVAKKAVADLCRTQRDTTLSFAARRGPELASKWGVNARMVIADLDAALRVMLVELAEEPMPFETDAA